MNTKEILAEITNKAKDFAAEMTSVNVQAKDLQGEMQITKEHVDNNAAVRQMLIQRWHRPRRPATCRGCEKGRASLGE